MIYILAILSVIIAAIIIWYFLPAKKRAFMPYCLLFLIVAITVCLFSAPYRIERIIADLTHLFG